MPISRPHATSELLRNPIARRFNLQANGDKEMRQCLRARWGCGSAGRWSAKARTRSTCKVMSAGGETGMLVSSVRHLPTSVKARPAPDALSPGRARFPTGIARSPWPTAAPRTKYSNLKIRASTGSHAHRFAGIRVHSRVLIILRSLFKRSCKNHEWHQCAAFGISTVSPKRATFRVICPPAPLGAPSISGHNPFWDLPLLGRTRPYIEGVNCSQYHI